MESSLRKKLYEIKIGINKRLIDTNTGKVLAELVEETNCPICNSEESILQKEKDGFSFVQCKQCELVYVTPRLTEDISDDFYISSELMSTLIQLQEEERSEEAEQKYLPILKKLEKFKGNDDSILDIGCSIGNFMTLASQYNWNVTGIELNKEAYERCIKKGLNVYNEKLEKLELGRTYQLITLFALIEHLYDPNGMLCAVKPLLNKDGKLLLFFPDWNWDWDHPQVNGRAHVMYFDLKSITLLLNNNGFKVLDSWVLDWLKGPKRVVVASLDVTK